MKEEIENRPSRLTEFSLQKSFCVHSLTPRFHSTMASETPTKEEAMNVHGSILNRHDDPFAPREGKTLIWKDVNMTLVCAIFYTSSSSSSILLRLL
jgi:hypothetical protein